MSVFKYCPKCDKSYPPVDLWIGCPICGELLEVRGDGKGATMVWPSASAATDTVKEIIERALADPVIRKRVAATIANGLNRILTAVGLK